MKNTKKQTISETPVEITSLLNANCFFLKSVFIIKEEKGFRLVATQLGQPMVFQYYNSLISAKIAFGKNFGKRKWKKNLRALWSCFYMTDQEWVKRKVSPIYREENKKGTNE